MLKLNEIDEIFRRFAAVNPNPRGELEYINPYTLLVAVALSAQATDASVNKATRELFKVVQTPADMLKLGEARLKPYIQTIGLYNTKAKNLIRMAEILTAEHGGEVPQDAAALEKLPGVGAKTAKVVLNVAFGVPVIAVDTHIFRLSNRLGMVRTKTPDETMKKLEAIVPEKYRLNAHHWLILHGRYVCVARKPNCPACILKDICEFKDKTPAEGGVTLKAKTKVKLTAVKKPKTDAARAKPKPRGRATA